MRQTAPPVALSKGQPSAGQHVTESAFCEPYRPPDSACSHSANQLCMLMSPATPKGELSGYETDCSRFAGGVEPADGSDKLVRGLLGQEFR